MGTARLKMGTRAQNFEHGTATKIGTGAEKVEGAETFSRGSLGTSSKRCRAQILKKSKICLASRMRKIGIHEKIGGRTLVADKIHRRK